MTGVSQILVRQDWRGLAGRRLGYDHTSYVSPLEAADDRFLKAVNIPWAELRDDYFSAFRRVCIPFLSLFANPGWLEPEHFLTRDLVENEFRRFRSSTVRLFDD